ncbi:MAG: bifunctional metallophosphatase/5'-nucleotidase [Elusimicrobiota bacterium]
MGETPRRVYVDLDDVLSQTAKDLARLLEEEFGKTVRYDDIRDFDLGVSFGLDPETLERFMAAAHRPEIIGRIPPMEGAAETLSAWKAAGLEVCVVTGRLPSAREASLDWLERNEIPFSHLMIADKYRRYGPDSGAIPLEEIESMPFLFAVDDAPPMIEFLAERMPVPIIVFDRPWNQGSPSTPPKGKKVIRCRSWKEIRPAAQSIIDQS